MDVLPLTVASRCCCVMEALVQLPDQMLLELLGQLDIWDVARLESALVTKPFSRRLMGLARIVTFVEYPQLICDANELLWLERRSLVRRCCKLGPAPRTTSTMPAVVSQATEILAEYGASARCGQNRWHGLLSLSRNHSFRNLLKLEIGPVDYILSADAVAFACAVPRLCSFKLSHGWGNTAGATGAFLQHCPDLQTLGVTCNHRCATDMTHWATYGGRILVLILRGCDVADDAVCDVLQACLQLHTLDLWDCDLLTEQTAVTAAQCCPCLTSLNIGKLGAVDDEIASAAVGSMGSRLRTLVMDRAEETIFQHCTGLQELRVQECLPVHCLQALLRNCRSITSLHMCGDLNDSVWLTALPPYSTHPQLHLVALLLPYTRVTDDILLHFAMSSPGLEVLGLNGCHSITAVGVIAITTRCPHLRVLQLRCCGRIGDSVVLAVAARCPQLQELDVAGHKDVTDVSVVTLALSNKNLRSINLMNCSVTHTAVRALLQHCKKLSVLKVDSSDHDTDSEGVDVVLQKRRWTYVSKYNT